MDFFLCKVHLLSNIGLDGYKYAYIAHIYQARTKYFANIVKLKFAKSARLKRAFYSLCYFIKSVNKKYFLVSHFFEIFFANFPC